eukprot:gene27217-32883_t
MVRLVSITIPLAKYSNTLSFLQQLTGDYVFQLTNYRSDEFQHITFKTKDKHLQFVLDTIQQTGCGVSFGQVDVMSLVLSKPGVVNPIFDIEDDGMSISSKKKRAYRVSDRMSVDEIAAFIDDGNHLTFNYIAQLAMASIIAGTGLLGDSSTNVIAAMLVSPLMGPILSITFGLAVGDKPTVKKGLRNEFVGIFIALTVGLVMGFIASACYPPSYRSSEMTGRGEARNLIFGFIVAFASGIAVVVAISMGGVNAIVGTAISASLLPPIVNCGICLAFAMKILVAQERSKDAQDYAIFGVVSFALFAVNFIVIVITGFVTFRYVKNVRPVTDSKHSHSIDSNSSTHSASVLSGIHSKASAIAMVSRSDALERDSSIVSSEAKEEGSLSEQSDHVKV